LDGRFTVSRAVMNKILLSVDTISIEKEEPLTRFISKGEGQFSSVSPSKAA